MRKRRNKLHHPRYRKPEFLATHPNELLSCDITSPCLALHKRFLPPNLLEKLSQLIGKFRTGLCLFISRDM